MTQPMAGTRLQQTQLDGLNGNEPSYKFSCGVFLIPTRKVNQMPFPVNY